MGQPLNWLEEEERLEQLAKAKAMALGESSVFQRKSRLRAAFDNLAMLMVIVLLGLLCWNWIAPSSATARPDLAEYHKAFYRALDEGPPATSYILKRTDYPFGLMPECMPPKNAFDRLLSPGEENESGKWPVESSVKWVSISPPELRNKKNRGWVPVRDLLREAPRLID